MHGWTGNQKGFSLIELIVSIAILAMIILPLSGLFINSVRTNSSSEDVLQAGQLAQQYLEIYKNRGVNDAAGVTGITVGTPRVIQESGFNVTLTRGTDITVNQYDDIDDDELSAMNMIIHIENSGVNQINATVGSVTRGFSIASNNDVRLTINPENFVLTYISPLTGNPASDTLTAINSSDPQIALICSGSTPIDLEVFNNTELDVSLFKVYNGGKNLVNVEVQSGSVYVINNNYTNVQNNNIMCPLTITVSKNGRILAETHAIIR